MMWYTAGKDLACFQVPVMDILAEFRALVGIKGRNAHRGHVATSRRSTTIV